MRLRAIRGLLVWGGTLALGSELLSAGTALTRPAVAVLWGLALAAGTAAAMAHQPGRPRRTAGGARRGGRLPGGLPVVLLVAGIALLLLLTGATALAAPPNAWDANTYHMSRVMHWRQHASLAPYPTHVPRQVAQPPFAELMILHVHLLRGDDLLANLVQWTALVGCCVVTAVVARELGAGPAGQAAAAAFCVSVPMAVVQASGPLNDLVVALWLACAALYAVRLAKAFGWADAFCFGAAIGLATLTKGTAYVLGAPLVAWVVMATAGAAPGARRGAGAAAVMGAVVLLLNAGQYGRNVGVFGSPLGPRGEAPGDARFDYAVSAMAPRLFVANTARNLALHAGAPPQLGGAAERTVLALHWLLRVDPHDPRTTWGGTPFVVARLPFGEDRAAHPLHVALLAGAGAAALRGRRTVLVPYLIAVGCGFVLFCALLRWQPWHARLHLPWLVLGAPAVGVVLGAARPARVWLVPAVLLVAALPWALGNATRPLLGPSSVFATPRLDQRFHGDAVLLAAYRRVADELAAASCAQVGLEISGDGWEYPLWVLLSAGGREVRLSHVRVSNATARVAPRSGLTCATVVVGNPAAGAAAARIEWLEPAGH